MQRKLLYVLCFSVIFLSGCSSSSSENSSNNIWSKFLLNGNNEYGEYQTLQERVGDSIDAEGCYVDEEVNSDEFKDKIQVSFATSTLLNINYFYDKELSNPIESDICYLSKGDTVFAKINTTGNVSSDTYEFTGFQIAGIDSDVGDYNYRYDSFDGSSFTIPKDCNYSKLSVIPIGAYKSRSLTFSASYVDNNNNNLSLSPIWEITSTSDKQNFRTQKNVYTISPNIDFRVKAIFDNNQYYYVDSNPKAEKIDDENGEVTFNLYSSTNAVCDYNLVLGKKFHFTIKSVTATAPVKILIDGNEIEYDSFPVELYAKLGENVEITSTGIIKDVEAENLLRLTTNGWKYSVGNESGTFEFDPAEYTYDNGTVEFFDINHNKITSKTDLTVGDTIYYKGTPDKDHTFSMGEGENKITVDTNIGYMLKNELKFNKKS